MATIERSPSSEGPSTLRLAGHLRLEDAATLRTKLLETLGDPQPPIMDLRQLEDCHPLCLGVLLSYANTLASESKAQAVVLCRREPPGIWFLGLRHRAIELREVDP